LQDRVGLLSLIGSGRSAVPPMKPMTFGVSLIRCQDFIVDLGAFAFPVRLDSRRT
jgi:hypothetical protein